MLLLRVLLLTMWLVLAGYTAAVVLDHGLGFAPVFFSDIALVNWSGQFNLDFLFMLLLGALWISWRHKFSPVGFGLGLLVLVGGITFLSLYLLIQSFRCAGSASVLLVGDRA